LAYFVKLNNREIEFMDIRLLRFFDTLSPIDDFFIVWQTNSFLYKMEHNLDWTLFIGYLQE